MPRLRDLVFVSQAGGSDYHQGIVLDDNVGFAWSVDDSSSSSGCSVIIHQHIQAAIEMVWGQLPEGNPPHWKIVVSGPSSDEDLFGIA